MKYVGEARAKYNPAAPLIGITPMGPINGTPTMHTLSHLHAAAGAADGDGGGAVHEFVGDDVMKMGDWKRRWQRPPEQPPPRPPWQRLETNIVYKAHFKWARRNYTYLKQFNISFNVMSP